MNGAHIFTLAGIPVFVSGWYLLILLFWFQGGVKQGLIWALAVTISLLVHEFGHGLVALSKRLSPKILLHGWGGLCAHDRAESNRDDVQIIAAGPAAGLLLGCVVYGAKEALVASNPMWYYERPDVQLAFSYLLFINFFWSFINLLPLWPLDGGQLFRLGLIRFIAPAKAERITHITGAALGAIACGLAIWAGMNFAAVIAGLLVWQNYTRINETSASGPIRFRNRLSNELLKRANEAMRVQDWSEAARLGHQIRSESNIDSRTLDRVWEILSISTTELGRFEEALSYIHRSQLKGEVYECKIKCVLALGKRDEVESLLSAPEAKRLRDDIRKELEALQSG